MGILSKHADNNYYDRTFSDFRGRLEAGRIGVGMLLKYDLFGSECVTCEQKVIGFKYRGERYDLHASGDVWIIHQCPQPIEPIYPDDPNVRDGSGNIVGGGWSDDTDRARYFDDDPYNYPDIPYVDPFK